MQPPRLCQDLPATGGRIKVEPEDFLVEEIPSYEPSGTGEHLYLWVEKRDLTGDEAIRRLSLAFDVPRGRIGAAGTKDRRAVTRQWLSVETPISPAALPDPGEGLSILEASRHTNRLRTGHLRGNRFRVRIREASDPAAARPVVDRIAALGLPNFFGPQRFGREGETARWGLSLLTAGKVPGRVFRNRSLRRLALSAGQAVLYNDYLSRRIADGLYRKVLPGDVLKKTQTGGLFSAEPDSVATEQSRLDAGEVVHAGPIFGRKTFPAHHEAEKREREVLESHGVGQDVFKKHGKLLQGTRRPDIVYPDGLELTTDGDDLVLSFTLPSGSYATVLLAEVMGP
jgi:tRNA pseudouridine13 synthase